MNDPEFKALTKGAIVPAAGVQPNIHKCLMLPIGERFTSGPRGQAIAGY
jgi:hypothetical protein